MDAMDDRSAVVWLHRRAGFGLTPSELEAAVARGPAAEIERLVDPDAAGIAAEADPWDDAEVPLDPQASREARFGTVHRWLDHMVATSRPGPERSAWRWHGHFVSAFDRVRSPRLMVDQMRLLRSLAHGPFPTLLRAVTVNPAMLVYLDGVRSTGTSPNENYARELLELFTLGVGQYTEDDVRAGAAALTGWTVAPGAAESRFVPFRHDDTPQRYLGVDGVHDVDTVVASVVTHPAMARFVAGRVARDVLGASPADVVDVAATAFSSSGHDIRALLRSVLTAGLERASADVVLGPVPWLVAAQRATGAVVDPRTRLQELYAAGQLPMLPPNVAGWPGGTAWFASSSLVARTRLAAGIAEGTPEASPALTAAEARDVDRLAEVLGLTRPFGAASSSALQRAGDPRELLALALVTPEALVA
jgi:uncharacterized protein (DUF1800 family)